MGRTRGNCLTLKDKVEEVVVATTTSNPALTITITDEGD